MKGILRGICRAVPFLLLAAVVLAVSLFPRQSAAEGESARIVRVWNVDTFEGGKGSRTAFLKRAAELAERGRTGVCYLVTSVTAEGALDALGRGELPDVLSYGGGLSAFEPHCLSLGERFAGESRALPWCRGEYYLFSMTDDFESAGDVAISVGGSNLACAAAYFAGVSGSETESLSAYVDFLGGKYRYLLGTQRDKCRFASRGAAVYAKPLAEFCDLYQYVSVLSEVSAVIVAFSEVPQSVMIFTEASASVSGIAEAPAIFAKTSAASFPAFAEFSPASEIPVLSGRYESFFVVR